MKTILALVVGLAVLVGALVLTVKSDGQRLGGRADVPKRCRSKIAAYAAEKGWKVARFLDGEDAFAEKTAAGEWQWRTEAMIDTPSGQQSVAQFACLVGEDGVFVRRRD